MSCLQTIRVGAGLFALVTTLNVYSNEMHDLSVEEKAHGAELIVIGKVIAIESVKAPKPSNMAVIRVVKTLKGQMLSGVQFAFGGALGASSPVCCFRGERYLFFLKKDQQGVYYSSNPPYGVYLVDK